MDLDDIISNAVDQDKGRRLEIRDPWTFDPTGIVFIVAGPDSATQRKARIDMMDELAEAARPDGTVSAEAREAARVNCLAKCILRMEIVEGGAAVPSTHKNIVRVLRSATWLEAQVDEFAGNRMSFRSEVV